MSYRTMILSIAAIVSSPLAAEPAVRERVATQTLGLSDTLNWSLSLVVVLAVFFLCVWLYKKLGSVTVSGEDRLRVLTGLPLGMREKVVLLQVGQKQLLLGVTPGRIDKLLELEGEQCFDTPCSQERAQQFRSQLLKVLKNAND